MRRSLRIAMTMIAGGLLAAASIVPASASLADVPDGTPTAESSEAEQGYFTVRPGSTSAPGPGIIAPLATANPVITAGNCKYTQELDYPHTSDGDASIHGWFNKAGGTCPKAKVSVFLQAWWCDSAGCRWVTVARSDPDAPAVYAGGGSANRVNARITCRAGSAAVSWRGYVDVDLVSVNDPSGVRYSDQKNLNCEPPGSGS